MRVQIHQSLDDAIREEAHRLKKRPGVVVTDIVRHALVGGPMNAATLACASQMPEAGAAS